MLQLVFAIVLVLTVKIAGNPSKLQEMSALLPSAKNYVQSHASVLNAQKDMLENMQINTNTMSNAEKLLNHDKFSLVVDNNSISPSFSPTEMDDFSYYFSPNKTDQILGYLQFDYWDGSACNGTKTYISGYATNQCNQHANGFGSYKVEFNGNGSVFCDNLRTLQYSDIACQNYYGAYQFESYEPCFEATPGTFLASGKMSCVVGEPVIDSNSTIMSYYPLSDTTCGNYANSFEAITNNYCYNVGALDAAQNNTDDGNDTHDDIFYQWKNDYMTCDVVNGIAMAYTYSNPDGCSQTLTYPNTESESVPLTCESTEYSPYDWNNNVNGENDDLFSSPAAPSFTPTRLPTADPSVISAASYKTLELYNLEQQQEEHGLYSEENKKFAAVKPFAVHKKEAVPREKSNVNKFFLDTPTAGPTTAPVFCPAFAGYNAITTTNAATCSFIACGGATLVLSTCAACTGDTKLNLYKGNSASAVATADDNCPSGGFCTQLTYNIPGPASSCANYTVYEGCNSGGCTGTTSLSGTNGTVTGYTSGPAVPSRGPTPAPTSKVPTHLPTSVATKAPTSAGFTAPSWTSTLNTASASQNYYYVTFTACGGSTLSFSGCACTGDEYIQLWYTNTTIYNYALMYGDEGCGSGSCSSTSYVVPGASSVCQSYSLHQGCYGSTSCSSQGMVITGSQSGMTGSGFQAGNGLPSRAPTPAPSSSGFSCPAYTSTLNTASATQNYYYCNFNACGGSIISVSGCNACQNDQYISLYNTAVGFVLSNDDFCGLCSGFNYAVPGNSSVCDSYSLREGCVGSGTCGGQVTVTGATNNLMTGSGFVSGTGPTYAPTRSPTAVPTTAVPSTAVPTTTVPTTVVPTTSVPTTTVPTFLPSVVPTTAVPSFLPSVVPTTSVPTTAVPSVLPSVVPTTSVPTTAVPSVLPSAVPTTSVPTIAVPSTTVPSTIRPTTAPVFCPAFAAYNALTTTNAATCSFTACGGATLVLSTCGACTGDTQLNLYKGNSASAVATADDNCPSGGYCTQLTYSIPGPVSSCANYTVYEGCHSSSAGCTGTTSLSGSNGTITGYTSGPAVPSHGPSFAPTNTRAPTAKPTAVSTHVPTNTNAPVASQAPTSAGFTAPSWSSTFSTNSASQNYYFVTFTACGGAQLTFSGCNACTGDEYIQLWYTNTTIDNYAITSGDDGCVSGACSTMTYDIPGAASVCASYSLHQGCYGAGSCASTGMTITGSQSGMTGSGYVGVTSSPTAVPTIVPTNSALPSFLPTVVPTTSVPTSSVPSTAVPSTAVPTIAPVFCPAFAAYNALTTTNAATCSFTACGGTTLVLSTCGACTGDTKLNLYRGNGASVVAIADDGCGSGYCTLLTYPIPGPESSCTNYTVYEGCNNSGSACTGTTSISGSNGTVTGYTSGPAVPSHGPTPAPTNTRAPTSKVPTHVPTSVTTKAPTAAGFIAPTWTSTLNTASASQNYYYVTFTACGGSTVTASGCSACTGDEYVQLWYGNTTGELSALGYADQGCSTDNCAALSYTVPGASSVCKSYSLHQGCYSTGTCSSQGMTIAGSQSGMTGSSFSGATTVSPTLAPTYSPISVPSDAPVTSYPTSEAPSIAPNYDNVYMRVQCSNPNATVAFIPSQQPTPVPTTAVPTTVFVSESPSESPSKSPSGGSIITDAPSESPSSEDPTASPTAAPSTTPSTSPVAMTLAPSSTPVAVVVSESPSIEPSTAPTNSPVVSSISPSEAPTAAPSTAPSLIPSAIPSSSPEATSTDSPSASPGISATPTSSPSSAAPSLAPSMPPSAVPTCAPLTTVPTTAPPTAVPTVITFVAPLYSASNTASASQNYNYITFNACGGALLTVSGCGACTADQYISMYYTNTSISSKVVTSADDGCSSGSCSAFSYSVLGSASVCNSFTLREGCYEATSCTGTLTVTGSSSGLTSSGFVGTPSAPPTQLPTPLDFTRIPTTPTITPTQPTLVPSEVPTTSTPTTSPSVLPSAAPTELPTITPSTAVPTNTLVPSIAPTATFACPAYSAGDTNYTMCSFQACGGSNLVISGCGCVGSQYLTLYSGTTVVSSNSNGCGTCAIISYTTSGSSTTCTTYSLYEGCVGDEECSGVVTVAGASSGVVISPTYAPISVSSLKSDNAGEDLFSGRNLHSVFICFPGLFVLAVKLLVMSFRSKLTDVEINGLNTVYEEVFSAAFACLNLIMSFNALAFAYRTPLGIGRVLLLFSRFAIGMSTLAFVIVYLLPYESGSKKDTANLSLFLNNKAMESKVKIALCGLKIGRISMRTACIAVMIASAFDLTVLRLLPWSRSEFTDKVSGYPNIFTVRCGLYGHLVATMFQSAASISNLTSFGTNSAVGFLVVSLINFVIALFSIVMFIQIAFSGTMKVNIIHYYKKEDGELEIQIRPVQSINKDLKEDIHDAADIELGSMVPPTTICVEDSETLSPMAEAEYTDPASGDVQMIDIIEETPSTEPELAASLPVENKEENEVIKDERGILFNTTIKYADQTLQILRDQLTTSGKNPLEYIPLADLKFELESLFNNANQGLPYDEARMDYLLVCMDANPEYKAEKAAETKRWRDEMAVFSAECLEITRGFVPPSIFSCSVSTFVEEDGYSPELAKRLIAKKCLWLVRVSAGDIERMHIAELQGRFNPQAQGLDIVETAAVYASLPPIFLKDHKKEIWRQSVENQLKMMDKEKKNNKLTKMKTRNPAYNKQTPAYLDRDSFYNMQIISSEDAFKPRTSFLSMKSSGDIAGDVESALDATNQNPIHGVQSDRVAAVAGGAVEKTADFVAASEGAHSPIHNNVRSVSRSLKDSNKFADIRKVLEANNRNASQK